MSCTDINFALFPVSDFALCWRATTTTAGRQSTQSVNYADCSVSPPHNTSCEHMARLADVCRSNLFIGDVTSESSRRRRHHRPPPPTFLWRKQIGKRRNEGHCRDKERNCSNAHSHPQKRNVSWGQTVLFFSLPCIMRPNRE